MFITLDKDLVAKALPSSSSAPQGTLRVSLGLKKIRRSNINSLGR